MKIILYKFFVKEKVTNGRCFFEDNIHTLSVYLHKTPGVFVISSCVEELDTAGCIVLYKPSAFFLYKGARAPIFNTPVYIINKKLKILNFI